MTTDSILKRKEKFISNALGWDTNLHVVKAAGKYVYTSDGKKYLDFSCGTATTNIGHNHPKVVEVAKLQLEKLIHSGCVFLYDTIVDLAEKLSEITPGVIDSFFFSNGGAEAVEGSIKLAKYVTGKNAILAFRGAFHGRTMGTVSITSSNVKYRHGYSPLLPDVYRAPFPYCYRCPFGQKKDSCNFECIDFIEGMLKTELDPDDLSCIVIEPVQGEGGYVVPPAEFMKYLRELADRTNCMLIFDEVQTGFGRTAKWFASEHFGVTPDIMSIAKGIASGFPLSAVCASKELMDRWPTGAHGTTFGGNPVSCAASLATISVIKEEGLLEKASMLSEYVLKRLKDLQERIDSIGDVRGLGYMIGIELVDADGNPAPELFKKIQNYALEKGLILISCGLYGNNIRFIPPLIVEKEDLDKAVDIIEEALKQ